MHRGIPGIGQQQVLRRRGHSHRNGARNVECARRREGRYRSGRWRGHARAHQRNDLRTSGAVGYRKRCLTCAHTQRAVGDGDRTVLFRDCHCSEDRLQHVGLTKGRSERARLRGIARDRIDEINLNAGAGRVAICRVDKVAVGIADFLENCQPVRERNRRGRKFLQRGGRIDIERSRTLLVGDLVLSVEQWASGSENNLGRQVWLTGGVAEVVISNVVVERYSAVTVPEAPGPKTAVSELAATIESPLGRPARLLAYIPGKAVPTVGHVGSACGRIQRHQKERGHLCAGRYASVAYRHIDRDAVTVWFGIDSSHLPQVRQRLGADRVQRRSRAPNVDETSVPECNTSPPFAVQFLC